MRWLPLVLLGCLAALASAGLFGGDELAPPADGTAAPPPAEPESAAAPALSELHADADAPGYEFEDRDAERTDGELVAGEAPRPRLRIVRSAPAMPVPGAEVFCIDRPEAERRQQAAGADLPPWTIAERWGRRLVADASGEVDLPAGRAPLWCVAQSGGEFGFAVVPPRPATTTLLLVVDEQVTIVVTGPDDRPAAVPVALLRQLPGREAQQVWRGTTGADGRAVVAHFQLVREPHAAAADETFAAVALVPQQRPAVTPFPGRPALDAMVRLAVPPLGSLAVLLVDHTGRPVLSPATLGFGSEPATTAEPPFRLPRWFLHQRVAKPAGPEPVELPHAEVGGDVRLFATFHTDRRPAARGPLRGPIEPGETAHYELPLAPEQVLLAGQLTAGDGTALGECGVAATLWQDDRPSDLRQVDPVAGGFFDLVLPGNTDRAERWLEFRAVLAAPEHAANTALGAMHRVPALTPGQRIELGRIALQPLPQLVHGAVIDDHDEPIVGAAITVERLQPPRGKQLASWQAVPRLAAITDEAGRFVVHGRWPTGTLRVQAGANQHFAATRALELPGQYVVVALQRHAMLHGRVLLPGWLADGTAGLTLQPADEAQRQAHTRRINLSRRRGGRFVVEPLMPGRHDAIVTLRNVKQPLLVLPDVFLGAGDNRDRRLDPLDLGAALFRWRLRAVDQHARPLPLDGPILARLLGPDGTPEEAGFRWRRGIAELIAPAPSAELCFFGRGIATQRLALPPGDHDVVLPTLQPAFVEVPGARALCGPDRRVRISAVLDGDTGLPGELSGVDQRTGERYSFPRWDLGRSSGGWLGATDLVEIPLMQPGTYEILLRAHATAAENSPQTSVSLGKYRLAPDGAAWAPVRVAVDAVAVAEALRQLDERQRRNRQG